MTDTVDNDERSDTTGIPPTPPPLRASDADRHAIVLILQDAVAAGLLTPDEGSERIATAYVTTHLRDLPALVADLPGSQPDNKAGRPGRPGRAGKPRRSPRSEGGSPGGTGRMGRAAAKSRQWLRAVYLTLLGALRKFLGTADGGPVRRNRLIIAVVVGVALIAGLGFAAGTALFDGHDGGGAGFDGHGVGEHGVGEG